ncbi:hypothetical protein TNCV_1794531 [Trichonephila clavipes]|nr:hypothetical protein TNCV_1794531 [Trichonephila clavipes]
MSKRFRAENCWGKPEAISELLKVLSDADNFFSEDKSENEDFIEVQNYEFTNSDREESDGVSCVCMDADKLLKIPMDFTFVGTIWKNKREIPPELLELQTRSLGTSM